MSFNYAAVEKITIRWIASTFRTTGALGLTRVIPAREPISLESDFSHSMKIVGLATLLKLYIQSIFKQMHTLLFTFAFSFII